MAGPADWGAIPDEPKTGPADWGAIPDKAPQKAAAPAPDDVNHDGYSSRYAGDTGDFFHEGIDQTLSAPGQMLGLSRPTGNEKLGEDMRKMLMGAGASEEEAKHESDRMLRKLQRGQGMWGLIGGPFQAVTSPLLGAFRSFVSRPIEEKTDFPKEATEQLTLAAAAALGMRKSITNIPAAFRDEANIARVRVSPEGEVTAQAIGPLPKAEDFKTAAEVLGGEHTEGNLRRAWEEQGIHPAEAVNDAQRDAFVKNEMTGTPKPVELDPDLFETLTESGAVPRSGVGADITTDPPLISPAVQPVAPPGRLTTAARATVDQLLGLGRNVQFMLDPMATGSNRAMVIAKDAISSVRRARWDWARTDAELVKTLDAEQLTRLWNAADEESVLRQEGKTSEHMGLATLTPEERALVEQLHTNAQTAWLHAIDAGIVESEGLPAYTPRMVLNVAAAGESLSPRALNELGRNVFTRTSQMLHRKHLTAEETEAAAKELVGTRMAERGASVPEIEAAVAKVQIARNIRSLPMATARLQEAVIWREMINKIEDIGKATGTDLVADFNPGEGWFTVAGHPAFTKWKPVGTDDAGNAIFRPHPLYMPNEFKGPMTAILDEGPSKSKVVSGAQSLYGALMTLKGKSMTAILNSPLIHNEVVWSKVAEAAGGREWLGFALYGRGNKIVNNIIPPKSPGSNFSGRAQELVERGLNPMGPRGAYQDISSMMEEPSLQGHQSWTGKILAFVPGLFDEAAGAAVERGIQKAGNFYHNTLLWDRVRDVQFGLADHLSDRLMAKGADRLTADRIAGHFSNIIVGSIPKEAMSSGARATANMLLFSRSFTLGNLSTYKQATMGLPKPILAQIERDFGISAADAVPGEAATEAMKTASGIARRKAISTVMLSAGMYYVGNALLQNAFNIAARDSTLDEEAKGYARRYEGLMKVAEDDPFELRHLISRLSPTYDNEPKKSDRIHIGYDKDGTAIYARSPVGKFGEEMVGYPTMPMEMVRRKLSPLAGGLLEILENDKGFGRKIYDENDTTLGGDAATAFAVAKHLVMKHLPEGQISAGVDLLRGEGDKTVNTLRLVGPALGFTASVGAPGGMARGEQLTAKGAFDARFNLAWPDIKKQIQRGDVDGARERMTEIGVPNYMQKGLIRNADNPAAALRGRTLRDFYQYSTPEQRDRLDRAR